MYVCMQWVETPHCYPREGLLYLDLHEIDGSVDHLIVLGEGATGGDPDQKFTQNPIRFILDFTQKIVQLLTDVCLEKKRFETSHCL